MWRNVRRQDAYFSCADGPLTIPLRLDTLKYVCFLRFPIRLQHKIAYGRVDDFGSSARNSRTVVPNHIENESWQLHLFRPGTRSGCPSITARASWYRERTPATRGSCPKATTPAAAASVPCVGPFPAVMAVSGRALRGDSSGFRRSGRLGHLDSSNNDTGGGQPSDPLM